MTRTDCELGQCKDKAGQGDHPVEGLIGFL